MTTQLLRRALGLVQTALLALALVAVLFLAFTKMADLDALSVLSGSMEPTYAVGSLVLVDRLGMDEITQLGAGEVITYATDLDGVPTTHRIVAVNPEGSFVTKGDANDVADSAPVLAEQVRGVVRFGVPLLGYATGWLQDVGNMIRLGSALVLLYLAGSAFGGTSREPDDDHLEPVTRSSVQEH